MIVLVCFNTKEVLDNITQVCLYTLHKSYTFVRAFCTKNKIYITLA